MISRSKLMVVKSLSRSGISNEKIAGMLCIKESTVERYLRINTEQKDFSKILIFDIETLPMEVYVWGLYKQQIPYENIIKEWSIVSWSAKWVGKSNIMSMSVSPDEAEKRLDYSIMCEIWNLFEEANIVIAHNASKFDVRKLNARWKINGLNPPSPYTIIDTLKVAQKKFAFSSHKLDYLVNLLNNRSKIKTEYSLWKRCCSGDEDAIRYMEQYNRGDVSILEDLYFELRPWIDSHPNINIYSDLDEERCPHCGNTDLDFDIEKYFTPAGRFVAFRCNECFSIGRNRISDLTQEERKNILLSTSR